MVDLPYIFNLNIHPGDVLEVLETAWDWRADFPIERFSMCVYVYTLDAITILVYKDASLQPMMMLTRGRILSKIKDARDKDRARR